MAIKMITSLLRKDKKQENSPIYLALINGLKEMKKQGVDRILLTLYESEPDEDAFGEFLPDGWANYYPFDILHSLEQKIILDGKTYTVISLVTSNPEGLVRYPTEGVEKCHRTRLYPMLSKQKPESEYNYFTKCKLSSIGDELRAFAKWAEELDWTPKVIESAIKPRIGEYHDITKRLMEKRGDIYNSIEIIEQRGCSLIEQMLAEIRENIELDKLNFKRS